MAISITSQSKTLKYFENLPNPYKRMKEMQRIWRETHREEKRESDKEYHRQRRALGLENKTEEYRIWRAKNPLAYKAQMILNYKIKSGEIKRGCCSVCGVEKAQGHHPDYTKPLEVRWLCPIHHAILHAKLRRLKN